jgi:uncharacterized protein (TIGR03790 family)
MRTHHRLLLLFAAVVACLSRPAWGEPSDDPGSVLILVNDIVPPEPGTGRKGASVFVGEYYAQKRSIPSGNIVHLSVPLGCCNNDPRAWDSWNISWAAFVDHIRTPVKRFLERKGLKDRIRYVVPTYGIPLRLNNLSKPPPSGVPTEGYSIDSFLASIDSGQDAPALPNPYRTRDPREKAHRVRSWANPAGWNLYLVVRLDGPSASIATGLVDKALTAEETLKKTDGKGYFDFRGVACCGGPYLADQTVKNAYSLSVASGFPSMLNDQSVSGSMIQSARNALWAWGWYSGLTTCECYTFVNGAVAAQLTSYTARSVRTMMPGAWVPLWLEAGITATWGATGEPFTSGYANGDNLLNHFWMGYTFGESSYLATPLLNWMMVFVGDPLYAPRIFSRELE